MGVIISKYFFIKEQKNNTIVYHSAPLSRKSFSKSSSAWSKSSSVWGTGAGAAAASGSSINVRVFKSTVLP